METDIANAPATYPERSLYYRAEVKAAVEEIERERDRAIQQLDQCRETAAHLSARSVPDIKAAVNEALEQAAKVAQNWGAESIAQNDPQDQHEKDIVFAQTLSALVISKGIRALKQE